MIFGVLATFWLYDMVGFFSFIVGAFLFLSGAKQLLNLLGQDKGTWADVSEHLEPDSYGILSDIFDKIENPDTAIISPTPQPVGTHPTMQGIDADEFMRSDHREFEYQAGGTFVSGVHDEFQNRGSASQFQSDASGQFSALHTHADADFEQQEMLLDPTSNWGDPTQNWYLSS